MSQQDQMLKAYLERVIALREQKSNALSERDLREIAGEIGLSDEDLLAADRAAQDHCIRGENYLKHGRHDDAIRELQDAVALAPGWLAYKSLLAQAFFERWRRLNREPDRHAAAQLARECIAIDADHAQAYQLLNQLDGPPHAGAPRAGGAGKPASMSMGAPAAAAGGGALLVVLAVTGISLFVCGGGVLGMMMFTVSAPSAPPESFVVEQEPAPPINGLYDSPQPLVDPVPSPPVRQGEDIPLGVELGENSPLTVQVLPFSRLKVYGGKAEGFYEAQVLLKNSSDKELEKPKLRVTFMGEGDEVLAVKDVYPASFAPDRYRPGDSIPVKVLHKVPSRVKTAMLKLESVQTKKAPKAYAESKPLALIWAVPSQQSDSVIVKERAADFRTYKTGKGSSYFVPELELHNTGTQEVDTFKVSVLMYGADNKLLMTEALSMVSSSAPSVQPGEVRVARRTFKAPAEYKRYELEVTELKFK